MTRAERGEEEAFPGKDALVDADGRAGEEVPAKSSSTVPVGSGPCATARLEPGGCSAMASAVLGEQQGIQAATDSDAVDMAVAASGWAR